MPDEMMRVHGTRVFALKPSSIVHTAREDLKTRRRKEAGEVDPAKPYCFVRQHVLKADTATDILKLALAEREKGIESGKFTTRLIYSDQPLLEAALLLAEAEGAGVPSTREHLPVDRG